LRGALYTKNIFLIKYLTDRYDFKNIIDFVLRALEIKSPRGSKTGDETIAIYLYKVYQEREIYRAKKHKPKIERKFEEIKELEEKIKTRVQIPEDHLSEGKQEERDEDDFVLEELKDEIENEEKRSVKNQSYFLRYALHSCNRNLIEYFSDEAVNISSLIANEKLDIGDLYELAKNDCLELYKIIAPHIPLTENGKTKLLTYAGSSEYGRKVFNYILDVLRYSSDLISIIDLIVINNKKEALELLDRYREIHSHLSIKDISNELNNLYTEMTRYPHTLKFIRPLYKMKYSTLLIEGYLDGQFKERKIQGEIAEKRYRRFIEKLNK
jgi:hypothetical protein